MAKLSNSEYCKAYRLKNIEKLREYDRKRYHEKRKKDPLYKKKQSVNSRKWKEANRDRHRERVKRWKKINQHQTKATTAVKDAVRYGRLVKASECSKCGSKENIEGHHHDYSKPLDVIWVCKVCHIKIHQELRQ